jgi:hypothetical protein
MQLLEIWLARAVVAVEAAATKYIVNTKSFIEFLTVKFYKIDLLICEEKDLR